MIITSCCHVVVVVAIVVAIINTSAITVLHGCVFVFVVAFETPDDVCLES
jgi:hypothetical protein